GQSTSGVRPRQISQQVATRPVILPAHSPARPGSPYDAHFSGERIHPPESPHRDRLWLSHHFLRPARLNGPGAPSLHKCSTPAAGLEVTSAPNIAPRMASPCRRQNSDSPSAFRTHG